MKFINPNPGCAREDCQFIQVGIHSTTLAASSPTYDKHGNISYVNLNETNIKMRCLKCLGEWDIKIKGEAHEITETKSPKAPLILED